MAETTINGVSVPFLPVGGADGLRQKPAVQLPGEQSFGAMLEKELQELKFSRHAQERLESRQIRLNDNDMEQLQRAVTKAEQKGSTDSLVMLRDLAFIVSVKNRTVVTAMTGEAVKENVFTNIDSAVIAA